MYNAHTLPACGAHHECCSGWHVVEWRLSVNVYGIGQQLIVENRKGNENNSFTLQEVLAGSPSGAERCLKLTRMLSMRLPREHMRTKAQGVRPVLCCVPIASEVRILAEYRTATYQDARWCAKGVKVPGVVPGYQKFGD
jgi:hypothetical protein